MVDVVMLTQDFPISFFLLLQVLLNALRRLVLLLSVVNAATWPDRGSVQTRRVAFLGGLLYGCHEGKSGFCPFYALFTKVESCRASSLFALSLSFSLSLSLSFTHCLQTVAVNKMFKLGTLALHSTSKHFSSHLQCWLTIESMMCMKGSYELINPCLPERT